MKFWSTSNFRVKPRKDSTEQKQKSKININNSLENIGSRPLLLKVVNMEWHIAIALITQVQQQQSPSSPPRTETRKHYAATREAGRVGGQKYPPLSTCLSKKNKASWSARPLLPSGTDSSPCVAGILCHPPSRRAYAVCAWITQTTERRWWVHTSPMPTLLHPLVLCWFWTKTVIGPLTMMLQKRKLWGLLHLP